MINGGGVVEAAQRGDMYAFSSLVERYQTPIFRYLYRLTSDTDLARRLTICAFVRAQRSIKKLDPAMRFEAWLFRVATQTAQSALRWRRPAPRLSVEDDRDAVAVQNALARLPLAGAAALLLHSLGGFSYDEIAQILRVSVRTVRSRLADARLRMQTGGSGASAVADQCKQAAALLSPYHDHQATADERSVVEAHIATCAVCRASLAGHEEMERSLARMKARGPSAAVAYDVMRVLRGEKLDVAAAPAAKGRRGLLLAGLGLALLVAVGAGALALAQRGGQRAPAANELLYVAQQGSGGSVAIVDVQAERLVATVPLGNAPLALAATRDGAHVYVLDDGSVVSVIAAKEQAVTDRYQLPGRAAGLALSHDEGSLYITLSDRRSLIVVDAKTGRQTGEVRVGRTPREVVASRDGQWILVFNAGDSTISKIKAGNRQETSVIYLRRQNEAAASFSTHPMALSPDGHMLYISELNRERIWSLNLSTNDLRSFAVPLRDISRDILVAPSGDKLIVTHGDPRGERAAQAGLAEMTLPAVERSAEIRGYYVGVAVGADGATIYATSPDENAVIFADVATLQTRTTVSVGQRPTLIVVAPKPR